jgi:hypothetical protein
MDTDKENYFRTRFAVRFRVYPCLFAVEGFVFGLLT